MKNNPINHILRYTTSVTNLQKKALIVYSACMAIDVIITTWGVIFRDDFTEINPVFNLFLHSPMLFVGVLIISKSIVTGVIIYSVFWFNEKESAGTLPKMLHGAGDLVAVTSAGFMVLALTALVIINIIIYLGFLTA